MSHTLIETRMYKRPRLSWLKRRARRIMAFYGVTRRQAVIDARVDYVSFTGDVLSGMKRVTS